MTLENRAAQKKKQAYNLKKDLIEWLEAIVFSVTVVVLLFTFVFRIVGVDGESMLPTLKDLDRVIISNLFYNPEQGDIVVISQTSGYDKPLIKRVIATEGQTVDIDFDNGDVYVDGTVLTEPYISGPTVDQFDIEFPQTVPQGKVFVLGDNRANSSDSRSSLVGMVDERTILGKAVLRIFPFDAFGTID